LFTGVVKGAQLSVWVFGNGVKILRGIQLAYSAVTGGITAVQTLYNLAVGSGFGATVAFGGAMTGASLAAGEMAIAEEAAMVGAGELAIAEEAAAAGAVEVGTAAVAAEAGIGGIGVAASIALAPIVAVTAAVAALAAAAYELYQLYKESGGADGMWAGIKGFAGVGTKSWGLNGYNQGVDQTMNAKARAERADANASETTPMRAPTDYRFGPGGAGAALAADARAPGPYAGGYQLPGAPAMPAIGPIAPIVSTRDQQSDAQAKSNQEVSQTLKGLPAQVRDSLKGVVVLKLPPGVGADTSGAPGVSVTPSGSY
jgi:hypothetical protein